MGFTTHDLPSMGVSGHHRSPEGHFWGIIHRARHTKFPPLSTLARARRDRYEFLGAMLAEHDRLKALAVHNQPEHGLQAQLLTRTLV